MLFPGMLWQLCFCTIGHLTCAPRPSCSFHLGVQLLGVKVLIIVYWIKSINVVSRLKVKVFLNFKESFFQLASMLFRKDDGDQNEKDEGDPENVKKQEGQVKVKAELVWF